MHSSSLMVAGGLAVIGVLFAAQKSTGSKRIGMVFATIAALFLVAGLSA
jgi:hypothetical protein